MMPPQDYSQVNAATANRNRTSFFVAIIMSVLFVIMLALSVVFLLQATEAQSDLDAKIEAANAVAVEEAESEKEVEFTERLKDPYETYIGPSTFGSLAFGYPKSWSALADASNGSVPLDFYAHPGVIPGLKDTNFGLRVQIVDKRYDEELKTYERSAEQGDATIEAYRPPKVNGVLGVVIRGEIASQKSGILVMLPQRDKTFKFFTESTDYQNDFAKVLETITFSP